MTKEKVLPKKEAVQALIRWVADTMPASADEREETRDLLKEMFITWMVSAGIDMVEEYVLDMKQVYWQYDELLKLSKHVTPQDVFAYLNEMELSDN